MLAHHSRSNRRMMEGFARANGGVMGPKGADPSAGVTPVLRSLLSTDPSALGKMFSPSVCVESPLPVDVSGTNNTPCSLYVHRPGRKSQQRRPHAAPGPSMEG